MYEKIWRYFYQENKTLDLIRQKLLSLRPLNELVAIQEQRNPTRDEPDIKLAGYPASEYTDWC